MKKNTLLYIIPIAFLCSCNKMLDVNTPSNTLYPSSVFSDSSNTKSALLGLYSGVEYTNTYLYWLTQWNMLYADEATTATLYPAFLNNALTSSDANVPDIWNNNYSNIYRANELIEGVQASTTLSTATAQQVKGEALFWRAYLHFDLLNIFGSIPLITSTNTSTNATAPQATSAAVFAQMISDLKQSAAYLPATYTVSGGERTRVNKLAAMAFLAKVYLYNQDWANAEAMADSIIGNSLFSLSTDLTKTFLNSSTEAILQFDNKPTGYVGLAGSFIPTAAVMPTYSLTTQLVAAFESGDLRMTNWTGTSAGYYYPAKYKVYVSGSTEYITLLRLAEIYLIRAEARAEQNNISGAQNDINTIRARAGLGITTAADQSSLLLAIEQERRVELFCEWGNRFYDLKRTGRADAVLGAAKSGWNSTDINYPIPAAEIGKNSSLKQNAGYN